MSTHTLSVLKRLGPEKQARLRALAYNFLPTPQWKVFDAKMKDILKEETKVVACRLKLPFGADHDVQRLVTRELKELV